MHTTIQDPVRGSIAKATHVLNSFNNGGNCTPRCIQMCLTYPPEKVIIKN